MQWVQYFKNAEEAIEAQWSNIIWPLIKGFDFSTTLEIAPGGGRNTARLLPLTTRLYLVELNQYALDLCRNRFDDSLMVDRLSFHINDGMHLPMIADNSITAIYTWDSAVHFDKHIIYSYLLEFKRTLKEGGQVFIHHSNYGEQPGSENFKDNPQWRSNMSAQLMADYCREIGLKVENQVLLDWVVPKLDCISILRQG